MDGILGGNAVIPHQIVGRFGEPTRKHHRADGRAVEETGIR